MSQEEVQIRKTESEDLEKIHQIAEESFKEPYPLQLLKQIHDTAPEGFLTAEKDGEVVGYLISMVRWEDTGHILAIAVDKDHRREEIGKALMDRAIKELEENGADHVKLEVRVSNEGAQEFYQELGFEPKKVAPEYYSDKEDALTMKYQL